MIVFNTTFHVGEAHCQEFLAWLREEYVPRATAHGVLTHPRLHRIMGHRGADADGGVSYALQLEVASLGQLQRWNLDVGKDLMARMASRFGSRVVAFSTMMEKLEL